LSTCPTEQVAARELPGRASSEEAPSEARPSRVPRALLHRSSPLAIPESAVDRQTNFLYDPPPTPHTRLASQQYCGKGSIIGASPDRSHVVIIPMRCKSWDCPVCGPAKRRAWIARFQAAEPEREITLTCPAGKWSTPQDAAWHMKNAWVKLVARIRRKYGLFEYGLVWELTLRGTPHMHILARGSYIPQKWLRLQWIELGIGEIVHIASVKSHAKHAAHICKYLAKDTGQTAMELAPMRIVQTSKNFLRPLPEEKPSEEYQGFKWVFDQRHASDVLAEFLESPRYLDSIHDPSGTVDVFLDPAPPPSGIEDDPELWVPRPGLQISDAWWRKNDMLPLESDTPPPHGYRSPESPLPPDSSKCAGSRGRPAATAHGLPAATRLFLSHLPTRF